MTQAAAPTPASLAVNSAPLLQLRQLTMRFGGVVALRELSISVYPGEIFALIGPNGAGKTTVFNLMTGVYRPTGGEIWFRGHPIRGMRPYRITKLGLARTFQNIRLFANMSALENVLVGTDAHHRTGVFAAGLGLPRHRREEREGRLAAMALLEFCGIAQHSRRTAKGLSYGDQRRLEIARALATNPALVLLDEPAAGMNPVEKHSLQALIYKIRDSGRTVLLIEHDMGVVMKISDRVAVLDFGQKIAEGPPAEVRDDPAVIEAYLGGPALAP